MKTTIELTKKEVAELIKKQLEAKGYKITSEITFNVHGGSEDRFQYTAPGLTSVEVEVDRDDL